MDQQTIQEIVSEIGPVIVGRMPGRIFQLNQNSLTIDFHVRDSRYLFISVEPSMPRLYLIERRLRDLEKLSIPLTPFALLLRKELSNTKTESIDQDRRDRIVRFRFAGQDESGKQIKRTLVAQLTGRTANLFLLNEADAIMVGLRTYQSTGPAPGDIYQPPDSAKRVQANRAGSEILKSFHDGKFASPSAAADAYYLSLAAEKGFNDRATAARAALNKEIARNRTLLEKLRDDLASHSNAEQQKRVGDLLLANLSTAKRQGAIVRLIDYFADDAPEIEIEIDKDLSLQSEAQRRFDSYSRSKRAVARIENRIAEVERARDVLRLRQDQLDRIIAERDEPALQSFAGRSAAAPRAKRKSSEKIRGARSYVSSDGYEVLVGRTSRDNDSLTFKVAKPNDLWLHAGDYPGSHVIVRNSSRQEIPQRTIIEAAQLAGYFSQARKDLKVAIHYTPRKFLSKPKGAAPGLVRLSKFKTMNVEPKESIKRIIED